jgi:hypothetical protein
MNQELAPKEIENNNIRSVLLGTNLAVAAMILVPALAMRFGLASALRIALMKAFYQSSDWGNPI